MHKDGQMLHRKETSKSRRSRFIQVTTQFDVRSTMAVHMSYVALRSSRYAAVALVSGHGLFSASVSSIGIPFQYQSCNNTPHTSSTTYGTNRILGM